jgi:hypothetical protein
MKSRKDKRDALIGELESIRTLLNEDDDHSNVPLLIPEDHQQVSDKIPVLSVIAPDSQKQQADDLLKSTRQAAAKIAAKAVRHHTTAPAQPTEELKTTQAETSFIPADRAPTTLPAVFTSSVSQREKLVEDVVKSALPRLEALLRELVQEALLQEKLRGGKR